MGNTAAKGFGTQAASVLQKAAPSAAAATGSETATFAAGCFWGVELSFQRVPGVTETAVGYTDGHKANPTYEEVCAGVTGHTEAVQMQFDPKVVSYDELLTVLFDRMNPTTLNRQGNDVGSQYRSGIYYHSDEQKQTALAKKKSEQEKYNDPIVVEIKPASTFYKAEAYHQGYLAKGGQCAAKGDTSAIRCYG